MYLVEFYQLLEEATSYGDLKKKVTGFAIDSRKIKPGELFFALPGEKVDGHQFVVDSLKKGAVGAIVQKIPENLATEELRSFPLIQVPNVLKAMQELALALRQRANIPVIGITGSSGKTTTKDLVAQILSAKYKILKTKGNFNNEIGLPLTLLQLQKSDQLAVLEMGMRGLGQIEKLCSISLPNYGIITNIGTAHYELLGSKENIAKAKGELLWNLTMPGVAILNRDDELCVYLGEKLRKERPDQEIFYFGFHQEADLRGENPVFYNGGMKFEVIHKGVSKKAFIPLPGIHNVSNALSALAISQYFDIPLEVGLASLGKTSITAQRLEIKQGINETFIIDDSYNANPASTTASLEVLKTLPGKRKIAFLGTHGELGQIAKREHQQIGIKVRELDIDYLLTLGKEGDWIAEGALKVDMDEDRVFSFCDKEEGIKFLVQFLERGDLVLIKGSRSMGMEKIVQALVIEKGGDEG